MISHKQLSTNSEKRGNFELFFEGLKDPKRMPLGRLSEGQVNLQFFPR